MLGEHPQLYGLPEVHLAAAERMDEWCDVFDRGIGAIAGQGLLRAVAELHFGGQTDAGVRLARRWVRSRRRWRTADVWQSLAEAAHPLGLVEKSPTSVVDRDRLERLVETFPDARFLHLVRHPRSQGESLLNTAWGRGRLVSADCVDRMTTPPTPDPQLFWYTCHATIADFLDSLPHEQHRLLRGEDLLNAPDQHLHGIAAWLGLRADRDAIEAMKHPEHSPFASLGPRGARFGNDPTFLTSPELRVHRSELPALEGPLAWRRDGDGFAPEVQELAIELGYS
jgi:hypothetical protein